MLRRGFTLIELLVVVAIIGVLASVVLASLNTARAKGRDARRKSDLKQLAYANELKYSSEGAYAGTAGWLTNWTPSSNALAPTYISTVSADPGGNGVGGYQYWRKDYDIFNGITGCEPAKRVIDASRYGFYAKLENPSTQDLASVSDDFDLCVKARWLLDYKVGN